MKTVWVVFKLHYEYDTPFPTSELDSIFASKTKAESYVENRLAAYKPNKFLSNKYWFEIESKDFNSEE